MGCQHTYTQHTLTYALVKFQVEFFGFSICLGRFSQFPCYNENRMRKLNFHCVGHNFTHTQSPFFVDFPYSPAFQQKKRNLRNSTQRSRVRRAKFSRWIFGLDRRHTQSECVIPCLRYSFFLYFSFLPVLAREKAERAKNRQIDGNRSEMRILQSFQWQ